MMESLIFRLLAAHILADFFLQPYSWVLNKKQSSFRSRYLYYHIGVVGLLTYLAMFDLTAWKLPLFITATHFAIDGWKSTRSDSLKYFLTDQGAHLLMILVGAGFYIGFPLHSLDWNLMLDSDIWVVLTAYLLVLRPAGFLIEKITRNWKDEVATDDGDSPGLANAGTWIGYIERLIILTLILLGQYSSIGFLIAAKSVFRLSGGIGDHRSRKMTEYILIGTLISFSLAVVAGILAVGLI